MTLDEFQIQTDTELQQRCADGMADEGGPYPYKESIFTEIVMEHMADAGMTAADHRVCHYEAKHGNASVRMSGYAFSEEADQLDVFISLYEGVTEPTPIADADTTAAASECFRFLTRCIEGKTLKAIERGHEEVHAFAQTLQNVYEELLGIKIIVITDRVAKSKSFKSREISGKTVNIEVMDIERLYRHLSEGKPRDEIVVNFEDVCGTALPCVLVPGTDEEYDCALTAIPGEAIRFIYEKYGARLLEANVRSFLSTNGKVNKGIRDTLRDAPERFMAYNNGLVVVADEIRTGRTASGDLGITWLKGLQIVNGGQTTASIYFSKKKTPSEIRLDRVRVPAKVLILRSKDVEEEVLSDLISDISRCANSQNAVKQSDLSANKPYHVELEKLAMTIYCPDGVGRWFYERAAGSYNTMLMREGTTPAKLRKLRTEVNPSSRKITKTELAKYLNTWDQKPHDVSFGSQKNYERFFAEMAKTGELPTPGPAYFKALVAKAIIFKKVQSIARGRYTAFQANVTTYTVAMLARLLRDRIDLDRIWMKQDVSGAFLDYARDVADEVNRLFLSTANGRMISEWAKKEECWEGVKLGRYPRVPATMPELRAR